MSETIALAWHVLTAPFPLFLLLVFGAAILVSIRAERHAHLFRKHMTGLWVCECGAARDRHGKEVSRG